MKHIETFENKHLSTEMVKNICNDMQRDRIEMLSLRSCTLSDKDFKKVCKSLAVCRSIRHLALTVNVVCDGYRVQVLAQGLQKNTSLVGLHLHGSTITDYDMKSLYPHLHTGNRLTDLDLSEGQLGDEGLGVIGCLLKEYKGLHVLTLSHNPNITKDGWSTFGMAIASGTGLRTLEIDYNDLGDTVACCLATALPGAANLEHLDLEYTGITDKAAQVLLHLVKSYNSKLKKIILKRNHVSKSTIEAIKLHLSTNSNSVGIVTDDEECSLTTSEPPIDKQDDVEETDSLPVVEVSPAGKIDDILVYDADVAKLVLPECTRSMVAIDLNGDARAMSDLDIKRDFSLTDIRQVNGNVTLLGGELDGNTSQYGEYDTNIQDHDTLRDETSISMAVQDIEQVDEVDLESTKLSSLSPHSIKGFEETDDTSKSGDQSPPLYQDHNSEPATLDVDKRMKNLNQMQNKHIVVASVESTIQNQKEWTNTTTKNEIEVRPMNTPKKLNGQETVVCGVDLGTGGVKTSGSLASKVRCANLSNEPAPVPLATKVIPVSVDPHDNKEAKEVPVAMQTDAKKENNDNVDFSTGQHLPKLNRRRGKRKGAGVDLAVAIRQNRQTETNDTNTETEA